jgi:hypothetical protein
VEAISPDADPRAAFVDLLAQATLAAGLPPLAAHQRVPQEWVQWLGRFDEALERAEQLAAGFAPDLAAVLQRLRDDLDRAVTFEPGSPLVVETDEVEAVAVLSMRLASSLLDERLLPQHAEAG